MEDIKKIAIMENGRKVLYDVLFIYEDDQLKRDYIYYTDNNDPNLPIYVSRFNKNDNSIDYINDVKERKMLLALFDAIKSKYINGEE